MANNWLSRRTSQSDVPPARRRTGSVPQWREGDASSPTRPQSTFRRNRTLTGSASSHVASGNELNAHFQSPRARVHHLTRIRRRLGALLTIVLLGGVALYLFVSQLVAHVTVATNQDSLLGETTKQAYLARLDEYYAVRPLERLVPLLQREQLYAYMTAKFSEIKTMDVQTTGEPGHGTLQLTLRRPVASWSLGGKNEFVDSNGIVFTYNAYATPSMQIIDSNRTVTASPGNLVASHRFLGFVGKIVGAAKQQGYTVTNVTIPPLTTRQLEARVEGVPYAIKLTLDKPAGEQMEDMGRVIRHLAKQPVQPKYIDVRVNGRAFYQ